jgi:hypothetical protein
MQPDLEERLRRTRGALPAPDPETTRRARAAFLARAERTARRRRVPLIGGIALAMVLVLALAAVAAERVIQAPQAEAPARVVDRTFACTTGVTLGLRGVKLGAGPRSAGLGDPSHAFLFSGQGPRSTSAGIATGPAPAGGRPRGAAWYTPASCRELTLRVPGTTRVRVPLTRTGLRGGQLTWPEGHNCEVPGRVLVRIRAVFTQPTRWTRTTPQNFERDPVTMRAPGTIREGYVAVRTESGNRPLAFAALTQTGARLFIASRCWRS